MSDERRLDPPQCKCAVCAASWAMRLLDAAHDNLLDDATEQSMALAWLQDESEACASSWRGLLVRRRLRKALRLSKRP